MNTKLWLIRLVVLVFMLMCSVSVLAQTGEPAPASVAEATPAVDATTGTGWLQLLITPATLVVAYGLRKVIPKIPKESLPFIVPFIGAALSALSAQIGIWQSNGIAVDSIAGVALGSLSTWVHQLGKQSGVIPETPVSDVIVKKTTT